MTNRIREFVEANKWLIRIVKDAFDSDCLVVDNLSAIEKVEIIPGVNLFREGDTWYVDDFSTGRTFPIVVAEAFFKEKVNNIKTLRQLGEGKI